MIRQRCHRGLFLAKCAIALLEYVYEKNPLCIKKPFDEERLENKA